MRPLRSALFFRVFRRRFVDQGGRAFLLGLLLVSVEVPGPALAQGVVVVRPGARPVWRDLGTAVVSYGVNRDAITVYDEQVFRALKFKVWDAPLDMLEAEVLYANGARDRVPIRQVVQRGQESSPLNLRGGPRRIRKVVFTYRFVPGFTGRRAKITLFGIR
jgi:hypothetical protein